MDKVCNRCKQRKSITEFHRDASVKSDGRTGTCKMCASEKQKEYRRLNIQSYRDSEDRSKVKRRREFQAKIRLILLESGCVDCGYSTHVEALQFDHLDREDKFATIANMVAATYSWERIEQEIEKCEVVCANCHAVRTGQQFNWYGESQVVT